VRKLTLVVLGAALAVLGRRQLVALLTTTTGTWVGNPPVTRPTPGESGRS